SFPSRSQNVAVGDINGDGKPDLVITPLFGDAAIWVLLNTTLPGSVTPTFSGATSFATGGNPNFVGLADLNGDGKLDVFATKSGLGIIAVLLNTTRPGAMIPSFSPEKDFAAGTQLRMAEAADINGDGKPDLVVVDYDRSIAVLLNTMAPGASIPTFAAAKS